MSKLVKIATIGAPYLKVDESLAYSDVWERLKAHLTEQINQVLPDSPDLIVLPEMCDIPDHYKKTNDFVDFRGRDNIDFFGGIARENNCNISFSTIMRGNGDYYLNTTCILNRDGSVAGLYDKFYVVPIEYSSNIRCGTETPLIPLDFGNVACAICFDLNFDDLRDRYKTPKPDLIIFSSMFHGGLMQRMWAQTCRTFFVGAISHSRPSAVISPLGETVSYSTNYTNYAIATINLDYELVHLKDEAQLAALKRMYGAGVNIFDPGNLGYIMLTSEMADISASEMIKEFDIISFDDYIRQSIHLHNVPGNQGSHQYYLI